MIKSRPFMKNVQPNYSQKSKKVNKHEIDIIIHLKLASNFIFL